MILTMATRGRCQTAGSGLFIISTETRGGTDEAMWGMPAMMGAVSMLYPDIEAAEVEAEATTSDGCSGLDF